MGPRTRTGAEISNRLVGGEETSLRGRVGADLFPELRVLGIDEGSLGAVGDAHLRVEVKEWGIRLCGMT